MKSIIYLVCFWCLLLINLWNITAQSNQKAGSDNYYYNSSQMRYSEYSHFANERSVQDLAAGNIINAPGEFNSIVDDLRVNEINGTCGADQHSPVMAVDDEGNYILAWIDYRNGRKDIYCKKYSKENEPLSECIMVNEPGENIRSYGPDVGVFPDGNFIIIWSEGSSTINAQIYSSSGQKQNDRFRVNSSPTYDVLNCNAATVAVDAEGNFMISWYQDYYGNNSSGKMNLYGRYFDKDGIAYGDEFKVNDSDEHYGGSIGPNRKVVSDLDGNYVIVWSEGRGGLAKIYLQAYNKYAEPIGTNQLVSDSAAGYDNYFPEITVNGQGDCLILWNEYRAGLGDGYFGRTYSILDGFISPIFEVIPSATFSRVNGKASIDTDDNFLVTYFERSVLKANKYSIEGTTIGDPIQIEYDFFDAWPYDVNMSINDDGSILMSWAATRNGSTDIWIQQFDDSGQSITPSFIPYDDKTSAFQSNPFLAVQHNGDFIVVWEDKRNGFKDIYAQRYNSAGQPIGNNILINEGHYSQDCENPVVAIDRNGNYFFAWNMNDYNIYLQKMDAAGNLIGETVEVNEQGYWHRHGLKIYFNDWDNILVTWVGRKPTGGTGIFGQKFSADLQKLNEIITYTMFESDGTYPHYLDYDLNDNWKICYSWTNYHSDGSWYETNYYAQVGINLTPKIDPIIISSSESDYSPSPMKVIANERNDFIIGWPHRKTHTEYTFKFQKIDKNGRLNGDNIQISDELFRSSNWFDLVKGDDNQVMVKWRESGSIKASFISDNLEYFGNPVTLVESVTDSRRIYDFKFLNGYIYSVREDNLTPGTGLDIYMNISSGLELVAEMDEEKFTLYQNYPNPFNSYTSIGYSLPEPTFITIKIYDALGREVKTLVNKNESEGLHQFSFDAGDLASGIYFYQLATPDMNITRKMLLIK